MATKISTVDLEAFESVCRFPLPEPYRDWVQENNGLLPPKVRFKLPDGRKFKLDKFFPFSPRQSVRPDSVQDKYAYFCGTLRTPASMVPFAGTDSMSVLFLNHSAASVRVMIWNMFGDTYDYEVTTGAVKEVAKTYADFIAGLY